MKVLITGGAGFIASHIVDKCIEKGWEVVVVDNLLTGKRENVNPKSKFYILDITDYKKLEEVFKKEKPQVVNHHAAQIDVRKSVANPQMDANINIIGSLNLLELSVKYKVKKFIFASSGGTIYGECKNRKPPTENSTPSPLSPYGCAKLSVEYYMNYYNKVFNLATISLRYANVYGPRQDPFGEAGVVAIFIRRMLEEKEVYIYGDGKQMRDFVYVGDVVDANIKSIIKDIKYGIYNVGTGEATSINLLYRTLAKLIDYRLAPVYKPARAGELFKSYLNISKIKKELNWEPRVDLEEGIENVVKYFKENGKVKNYTK